MKLCRCDMCETVLELEPAPTPYGEPPGVPKGWAAVSISRVRSVSSPAPANRHTMTIEGEMGELELTAETDEQEGPRYDVHAFTQLHLCPKCLDRLAGVHPAVSKQIAADDARSEGIAPMPMAATAPIIPAMRVSMRRK